jgi:hypothetical protein
MKQLKYRRRNDAGVTRVWVGRRRTRVLKALIGMDSPETVEDIASRAGVSYALANDLLEHLDAAGYVTCEKGLIRSSPTQGDVWGRHYMLNYGGEGYLAVFLAPRV